MNCGCFTPGRATLSASAFVPTLAGLATGLSHSVHLEQFHQAMLSRHLAPADALRRAPESVRSERRRAALYYWAGFTLVGEWK
jgi:hypothetical protein